MISVQNDDYFMAHDKNVPSRFMRMRASPHLDLSRCLLLHKSLQPPVLRTVSVVIQPESSGWLVPG